MTTLTETTQTSIDFVTSSCTLPSQRCLGLLDQEWLLRLTVRLNVQPKCGNNSSKSLHMFLLFWVSPKFCYRLRTRPRSKDILLHLSYVIGSMQATVQSKCLSDQLRAYVFQVILLGSDQEFELDSRSPEVVTANQRACEVRIRDWSWESRSCYYQVTR